MKQEISSLPRPQAYNPDHHIWQNHGTWWCHFTVHLPDYTKKRVRLSLETDDRDLARHRRDAFLALLKTSLETFS